MYYGTEMNALNFGNKKVKVQGHGGITYAGTVTAQADAYSTERLMSKSVLLSLILSLSRLCP